MNGNKILKLVFILLILVTSLFSSVEWQNNYNEAIQTAQEENKRIYMLIVSDDCVWCRKFKNQTLTDKKILKRLDEKYVLLLLNRDDDFIPRKFKTAPIPRHYFLTSKGKKVFPVVGYRTVDTFNTFLDDVEKRYERIER